MENITKNTIIYQGEEYWSPIRCGNSVKLNNYTKDWFKAGLKAQELFKRQAKAEKLILEELFQDEHSFKQYLINDEYKPIKRGDFLVRNYKNIEIDVKCRSFYKNLNNEIVFNFKCDDIIRHLNMQEMTNTPILIAVYERDGANVVKSVPYFFSISKLDFNSLKKVNVKSENTGKCYQIPVRITNQSFSFIKDVAK